eukprot:TRINITY_DN109368_c0_g1_i1.p1 TRINITY_DN109368_c0_g1~~TRINITY_DN109368_c0_g1_i1.p1  ORF type:complete len:800 (+),score=154.80 TRINITY_DN109368_c0_g1_i1:124-2523(+)
MRGLETAPAKQIFTLQGTRTFLLVEDLQGKTLSVPSVLSLHDASSELQRQVASKVGVPADLFYLTHASRRLDHHAVLRLMHGSVLRMSARLQGGGCGASTLQRQEEKETWAWTGAAASMLPGPPTWIEKTEMRGISLPQLRQVMDIVRAECHNWPNHEPEWHIEELETDEEDEEEYAKHPPRPQRPHTPGGAPPTMPTMQVQAKEATAFCVATSVNLYQVSDYLIRPQTKPHGCSFVELVAAGPQSPLWFVSHWWGEPHLQFIRCLEAHALLRQLQERDAVYWVCAYANNQWDIEVEIVTDPAETSFRKALDIAVGTVSVVDPDAVTYTRIWCSYEVATTLRSGGSKLYDVATALPDKASGHCEVVILADGLTAEDEEQGAKAFWEHRGGAHGHKLAREKDFPESVFAKAYDVRLENGSATTPNDRIHILNSLAGRELTQTPLAQHDSYDQANTALRWRFGVAFFHVAAELGLLSKYGLEELPEPYWQVGDTYSNMAASFYATAKYKLALHFYQKDLNTKLLNFGEGAAEVGICYNNMAIVYKEQSKFEQALQFYEKSLSIIRKTQGDGHPEVGDCYNNIAVIYFKRNKYEQALYFHVKSLAIRRAAFGDDHPDVGDCYNNMAIVYNEQSKYEQALNFYVKSLAIRQAHFGEEHPSVGDCYNNIAMVYEKQCKYEEALDFYEKSLAIIQETLGDDHPEVGDCYYNMALVYDKQTNYEQASEFYRKSLEISRAALGDEHPDVGGCYNRIGLVCLSQNLPSEARKAFAMSAAVFAKAYGPDHSDTKEARAHMLKCDGLGLY